MEKIESIEIIIKIYPNRLSSLHDEDDDELSKTLIDNISPDFEDIAGLPLDDIEVIINR
jgi:phenylpyruvate tautomerase PptA (4-oxalocrotonate tautomerase family)